MNKNQIVGIFVAILFLTLGLLWEKDFKYAGVFDFFLGIISAIGISYAIKIFPFKRKRK